MAVNKVVWGTTTLIDLTADTVTPENVLSGAMFHKADGQAASGSVVVQTYYTGSSEPPASLGVDGDLYFQTG